MKSILDGLSIQQLEEMDAASLRRLWMETKGSAPPSTFTARLMRLALAWDAQMTSTEGETANVRRAWNRIIRNRSARRSGPAVKTPDRRRSVKAPGC